MEWDRDHENRPALKAEAGTLLVRGCEFQADKPQIELGAGVRRAVVADNVMRGKLRIANHSTNSVQIANNAPD